MAAAAPPPPYTLVEAGQAKATSEDSKAFLETHARGPYTTARTVGGGDRVFELTAHVERLATTAALMWPDQALPAELTDPAKLRPLVVETLRRAIQHYRNSHPQEEASAAELKLTLLLVWQEGASTPVDCLCHVGPLPPIPRPPIKVEIRGAPRHNAKAKDSQWVRDRKGLEALKPADVNEIILHDEEGRLLEGTQTNFYAVKAGGILQTAGEGVLEGTVRRLVLQVCAEHGIPVDLSPPQVAELASSWEGALISSTSRLALPVDWVSVPREGLAFDAAAGDVSRAFDNGSPDSVARRVSSLVAARVLDASEPVFS